MFKKNKTKKLIKKTLLKLKYNLFHNTVVDPSETRKLNVNLSN